jgi:hypothetical protein
VRTCSADPHKAFDTSLISLSFFYNPDNQSKSFGRACRCLLPLWQKKINLFFKRIWVSSSWRYFFYNYVPYDFKHGIPHLVATAFVFAVPTHPFPLFFTSIHLFTLATHPIPVVFSAHDNFRAAYVV